MKTSSTPLSQSPRKTNSTHPVEPSSCQNPFKETNLYKSIIYIKSNTDEFPHSTTSCLFHVFPYFSCKYTIIKTFCFIYPPPHPPKKNVPSKEEFGPGISRLSFQSWPAWTNQTIASSLVAAHKKVASFSGKTSAEVNSSSATTWWFCLLVVFC